MGLAAGAIAAGVIGAGASIATGAMQAGAAKDAANAQVKSNDAAIAEQQRQFDINQANLQPWLKAGQAALGQFQNLSGANGASPQTTAIQALQSNPLYLAETGAGNQAILANASATGGLRSGNANFNLAQFNANALANVYQQQLGSLGALSGLGQSTGGTLGSLGANTAGNISALLANNGSANAGGILAGAGAFGGGINNGLSQLFGGLSTANSYGGFGGFGAFHPATELAVTNPYASVSPQTIDMSGFTTDVPVF